MTLLEWAQTASSEDKRAYCFRTSQKWIIRKRQWRQFASRSFLQPLSYFKTLLHAENGSGLRSSQSSVINSSHKTKLKSEDAVQYETIAQKCKNHEWVFFSRQDTNSSNSRPNLAWLRKQLALIPLYSLQNLIWCHPSHCKTVLCVPGKIFPFHDIS